jgi:RNA polymerase sigma-70 factor (ECF subfamily)
MAAMDPARLGDWFEVYAPALVLYARQWLEHGRAEDVVQEVFVRLAREPAAPRSPKAWLFRSVRNAAISRVRTTVRRRVHEARAASEREPCLSAAPDALLDSGVVARALLRLPAAEREAIVLRLWAGMTLREVAAVAGSSPAGVLAAYRRGLAAIRETLGESCATKTD